MSDHASARRDAAAAMAVVAVVLALVALRHAYRALAPRPSSGACEALVERYLRDKSRERFPALDDGQLERLARSADRAADVASCRRDLTASQVSCGLEAPDVAALERCMQ